MSWRLAAGVIDRAKASVFAEELSALGDVAAAAVAAAFTGQAARLTTGQLRAGLRQLVLYVDPDAARRRRANGRQDARVEAWQEGSGNGAIAGRELPTAEMMAADKRIDAIARALKQAGATGSLEQLRAAVFTALLTGRDPNTLLPGAVPARVQTGSAAPPSPVPASGHSSVAGVTSLGGTINLVIPFSAWLGLSEAPGEAAGYGPLDAATCRDLAAKLAEGGRARWCITVTDDDGEAIGHGCARAWPGPGPPRTAWLNGLRYAWLERGECAHARMTAAYRPGPRLRHLIQTRHRTCAFPTCRRSAAACDLDHTVPWDEGGRTCECGLAPLCREHHHTKQAEGWRLDQPEPGRLTWTAPHGRSYPVKPDRYPV